MGALLQMSSMPHSDEPTTGLLKALLDQSNERHAQGHERLRDSITELRMKLDVAEKDRWDLRMQVDGLTKDIRNVEKRKTDLSNTTMPTKVTVALLVGAITMAVPLWRLVSSVSEVTSEVSHINDRITQRNTLEDERYTTLMRTVEDLKKRQELTELVVRDQKGKR